MKMIIKDKTLEKNLTYFVYDLIKGWRGMNRDVWLYPPPTPFFEVKFRFAYFNNEEALKFLKLLHNLMILGHYINEIIIEKEFEPDSLYEKIYIQSYNYEIKRNPHIWEYEVHFEALKVTSILSPEEKRACEALTLIHTGKLFVGVK